MVNLRSIFNRIVAVIAVASFVCLPLAVSGSAFADTTGTTCTPPVSGPGVHQPTGADAGTYTYNCTDGLWENQYYSYDPATGLTSPLYPIVYTCDPSTGLYTYTTYIFNATSGGYDPSTQTVSHVPDGATVVPCPAPQTSTSSDPTSTGGDPSVVNNTLNNNQTANNQTGATVNNSLTSTGTSGNALVSGNTTGGSATSGDAAVVANEMNLVQSTTNFGNGIQPVTFVTNINGDVNGDFLLDPASLSVVQPAASTSNTTVNNNLAVNNTTNANLNNQLNLAAQSGDAGVTNNTTAGNATTGNATAVANLVNLIDSAITAGQSFIGVVNINGNLNGDILLPANFVDQLIADNVPTVTVTVPAGPNSNNTINNSSAVTNNTHEAINNAVTATAASGVASVTGNTNGGSATTGSATTHVTAFNLTGSSLIGSNDLLVFVNVLGKWVGLIVNAPPGATAAELGGGITNNTPANNSSTLNNDTNEQINNNVNVKAGSGDATVQHNTTGGNATTGNADAAVNLMNIENSSLSMANWFGILFINVFGTWNGSFGINTSAGDPLPTSQSATGGVSSPTFTAPAIKFVPHLTAGESGAPQPVYDSFGSTGGTTNNSGTNSGQSAVLASHIAKSANQPAAPLLDNGHINWWLALSGLSVFGLYLLGSRLNALRRAH